MRFAQRVKIFQAFSFSSIRAKCALRLYSKFDHNRLKPYSFQNPLKNFYKIIGLQLKCLTRPIEDFAAGAIHGDAAFAVYRPALFIRFSEHAGLLVDSDPASAGCVFGVHARPGILDAFMMGDHDHLFLKSEINNQKILIMKKK